eukprot:5549035-Lingulodinium_polyedra.AAC.1
MPQAPCVRVCLPGGAERGLQQAATRRAACISCRGAGLHRDVQVMQDTKQEPRGAATSCDRHA